MDCLTLSQLNGLLCSQWCLVSLEELTALGVIVWILAFRKAVGDPDHLHSSRTLADTVVMVCSMCMWHTVEQ